MPLLGIWAPNRYCAFCELYTKNQIWICQELKDSMVNKCTISKHLPTCIRSQIRSLGIRSSSGGKRRNFHATIDFEIILHLLLSRQNFPNFPTSPTIIGTNFCFVADLVAYFDLVLIFEASRCDEPAAASCHRISFPQNRPSTSEH